MYRTQLNFWNALRAGRRLFICLILCGAARSAAAQTAGQAYALEFVDRAKHQLQVTATFQCDGAEQLQVMMPTWSPGYYVVQDYAEHVTSVVATASDNTELPVERPRTNRWVVACQGHDSIQFRYQLHCENHFVTTNWVGEDFAALAGCATFVVPVRQLDRPCTVTVALPDDWTGCAAGLPRRPLEGNRWEFSAPNYDILVDSPIVAGKLREQEFTVGPCRHVWVDVGDPGSWEIAQSAADAQKIAEATRHFWGELPYDRYYFLNVFRPGGGGGLEHSFSTLLTASGRRGQDSWGWHSFVSHEYFHTINVKRLRPVELGPFDYEQPPRTPSLWISEGLTTYFGDLMLVRGGMGKPQDFLNAISGMIGQLQKSPGRLQQSLGDASLRVWETSRSGVSGDNAQTISYYVKGPVVGFLLDAKIRAVTQNEKSLDDVMRAAFAKYSGDRGFTEQQFRDLACEIAGQDLRPWFQSAIDQPVELDYDAMLDWYGLEFLGGDDARTAWNLQVADDATPQQQANLQALFALYPTD